MTMVENEIDNALILAVETSGRQGSVALAQGPKLLDERQFSGPMRHSAEVFPAIVDLLSQFCKKPDQIEQIYISAGPGSFTGLRIAVTIAKSMALANNVKIVAVDTLDIIAAKIACFIAETTENTKGKGILKQGERLGVILDAKRGQFFTAVYESSGKTGWQKILPDCLMTAEEFLSKFTDAEKQIALIGEGLVFYKGKFAHKNVRVLDEKLWNPSAAGVHKIGWEKARYDEFTDPLILTPNYLRQPDVKVR
jgi:tRNA threonylcarbamoyladenosine biosynthesis protein TsaB